MIQDFVNSVKEAAKKEISEIHTALPGVFVSYNPETNMAVVRPKAMYRKPNGEFIQYPEISGVPVAFPQSNATTIAFPIEDGDGCLIIFGERSLDYWIYGKTTGADLRFDLSNAMAIPNVSVAGNDYMKMACKNKSVVVRSDKTTLEVRNDKVEITGELVVNGKITASGDVIAQKDISLSNHTHIDGDGERTTPPT